MKIQTLLPSTLSGTRIILAFLFLYCYLNELWVASIILYVAALSTDYLDGILARKLDATSNYGAYLDTFADFILIITIFTAFVVVGIYPYWILILLIFMFLQFVLTSGSKKPIYDPIGKYYGTFLFTTAGITLIFPLNYVTTILLVLMVLISFISLFTRFYSLYIKK